VDAKFLEFDNALENPEIVHLFQDSPAHMPVIEFIPPTVPVVLSSITPGANFFGLHGIIWRTAEKFASLVRIKTCPGIFQKVVDRADRVIVSHSTQKQFYLKNYRIPTENIKIIPNGVRAEFFQPCFDKKQNSVAFLGAIIPRKNPLRLAQVLVRLGIPGVFAGPAQADAKNYFQSFLEIVRQSNGLLKYYGKIGYGSSEHLEILRNSKVFCLPSSAEVQSLAALEASASDCIVVLGDRPYARNEPFEKSITVDPASLESIEFGIRRALGCESNSRLDPAIYSWGAVAAQINMVYKACLSERARGK
jgi:glycosyltransferase involved in cell wall biosynthesis